MEERSNYGSIDWAPKEVKSEVRHCFLEYQILRVCGVGAKKAALSCKVSNAVTRAWVCGHKRKRKLQSISMGVYILCKGYVRVSYIWHQSDKLKIYELRLIVKQYIMGVVLIFSSAEVTSSMCVN